MRKLQVSELRLKPSCARRCTLEFLRGPHCSKAPWLSRVGFDLWNMSSSVWIIATHRLTRTSPGKFSKIPHPWARCDVPLSVPTVCGHGGGFLAPVLLVPNAGCSSSFPETVRDQEGGFISLGLLALASDTMPHPPFRAQYMLTK